MNSSKPDRTASFRSLPAALTLLLLASSTFAYAQNDKRTAPPPKQSHQSQPAVHSAPPPAPANHPAQSAAPSRPAEGPANHSASPSPNPGGYHPAASPNAASPNPGGYHPAGAAPGASSSPSGYHPAPGGASANPGSYRPGGSSPNLNNNNRPSAAPSGYHPAPGGAQVTGRGGYNNFKSRPNSDFHGANGAAAHFGSNGQVREVHANGMTITHGPGGMTRTVVERPGGRVIVTTGGGHGYVQRPVIVRGQTFVQRSYYVNGVSYSRVYRPYLYGGISYNVYTPVRFYSPGFYAYAYSPWATPVSYRWGWGGSPWFGFYGGYFTPYPVYASPTLWLTDYLVASALQDAYQARLAADANAQAAAQANYGNGGQTPLSPEVKQAISSEVQRQLAQEKAEGQMAAQNSLSAPSGPPPILSRNNPHVFVVSSFLTTNAGGQDCGITQGDVLQMTSSPSTDPNSANVQVLASKANDCRVGSIVPVQLADLQEMQNHMRETIDQGLGDLQTHQGQSGLPALPPAMTTQTAAPYAAELPQPEADVASQLQQQSQQATATEQSVLSQASNPEPVAPSTQTLTLGMTIDQVIAIQGKPLTIVDLGQKKTYVYKDLKIIFMDGKMVDSQ